jgi:hypothetical protein
MAMLELPALVKATLKVLLPLTITFPKFKFVALAVNCPGEGALTIRVAVLLVTFPAVLLTTAVNCAPLSEPVVAGVA